jgi:hypothetical protein
MPPIPHRRNRTTIVLLLIIVILLLILGVVCYRCRCNPSPGPHKTDSIDTVHWAGWNILFQDTAKIATRAQVANAVDDSLRKLLVANGIDTTKIHPVFKHYFCPCDTTLLNVDLTLINESGNPVTPSSPTNPQPPPSLGLGGSVFKNSYNTPMFIPEYASPRPVQDTPQAPPLPTPPFFDSTWLYVNTATGTSNNNILAILDTGLDSTEFKLKTPGGTYDYTSMISSLVWKDPSRRPTLYNTLVDDDQGRMTDDETAFKHGTSVAYIALLAAVRNAQYHLNPPDPPHLMVLKVLDSVGRGSVFTISCGMSYAIQKKATVINTSLGYAGPIDSVLEHYFRKANDNHIPVMVAAGNDSSSKHIQTMVCTSSLNATDTIGSASPFYPACFSKTMPYITTVTGVDPAKPCYYQKFSDTFVNVGVNLETLDKNGAIIPQTCCSFYIPYLNGGEYVEGSSFSTPVITGSYLYTLSGTVPGATVTLNPIQPPPPPPHAWLQLRTHAAPTLRKYIEHGRYLTYSYQ